ncbi:TetR/AcrR family transcriptional regulator [Stenomitos frigidus ULC18]|uniref:TetR/AcrR family transcriptional regulator n=2 Tax=Stenomitos TaxID=1844270 RepID=A0A2T1EIH3_9CYAN|nr:TetR/AcrR family transcriptional regulator [Stenomitos frigidus ULC18]
MLREEAVGRLVNVFRQYGYEGATLARLSSATGLGKASLYHHFPGGKEEMGGAVLEHLKGKLEFGMLIPLRSNADPVERLLAMARSVDAFYNHGQQACLLAMLALGEANDMFHTQIQHVLNVWIDALAGVAIDAGIDATVARQRAEDAILQIQGALILAKGLGDTAPFQRVLSTLPDTLLTTCPSLADSGTRIDPCQALYKAR